MSGFSRPTHHLNSLSDLLTNPPNSHHPPSPKPYKRSPRPYTPIPTRSKANTKYDVRSTYPADHTLRRQHRVHKPLPSLAKARAALCRRSKQSSASDSTSTNSWSRDSSQDRSTASASTSSPTPAPQMEVEVLPSPIPYFQYHYHGREAIEGEDIAALVTVLRQKLYARSKRRITALFAWLWRRVGDIVGCVVDALDFVAAVPSVVMRHTVPVCECGPASVFWDMHGVDGMGVVSFLLAGEGGRGLHGDGDGEG